jgi:hypothetical protein
MMDNRVAFYTKTMAKVYADQGHWEKSEAVYRHLLKAEPDRQDLIDALSEVRSARAESKKHVPENLVALFTEWIELMIEYNTLIKLNNLRRLIKTKDSR